MATRTKRGANRRYQALYRKMTAAGGGLYGFDLPTIRQTHPEIAQEIDWILNNYENLPE